MKLSIKIERMRAKFHSTALQSGLSVVAPPPLGVGGGGGGVMGGYDVDDGIQLSVKINDHNR